MKKKISLLLNSLIVLLGVISFIITYTQEGRISLEYYTIDSNLLTIVSSLLFCIFILLKKKIPRLLSVFKYMTTVCLTITFLVVIFILGPLYHFNYEFLLLSGGLLYQHLIIPVLSVITFLFFDDEFEFKKYDVVRALSFTVIYSIVLIILNILKVVDGPYEFLKVYDQPIFVSVIWAIGLMLINTLIAYGIKQLSKELKAKELKR